MQSLTTLLTLLFVILFSVVTAQSVRSITGNVSSKSSKEAISYANIYIDGTAIGTITNNDGNFQLFYNRQPAHKHLVISCIGYDKVTIPLDDIKPEETLRIKLDESATFLNEILIQRENAVTIMTNALKNLKKNYEAPPHRMEAFYRTTMQDDGSFTRLLEAAVFIEDPKGNLYGRRNINIREIRKSNDLRKDKWKTYDGYLTHLVRNHPLQTSFWDFMHKRSLSDFDISIKDIVYQDKELFYILQLNPKKATSRIPYTAKITISETDFGIHDIVIYWKPALGNNYSWAWERRPDANFNAHWQESHYTYQPYQGKYYLKSAKWHRKGQVINNVSNDTLFVTESLDELLITNIEHGATGVSDNASAQQDIYAVADNMQYNPSFWKTYNRPVDSEHFKKAKLEMERMESLEQQFRKYTGNSKPMADRR